MSTPVTPIPPAVKAEALVKLNEVVKLLQPYQVSITDAERKSLGSTAMGRESIPFAEQAEQLFTNFKDVLTRAITDDMLAQYPVYLQAFRDADDIQGVVEIIVGILSDNQLVTGNFVMGKARTGYKNGQDDKGKTPGLAPLIHLMSQRFPNGPKAPDGPTPPPAE